MNNSQNFHQVIFVYKLKKEGEEICEIVDGSDKRAGVIVYSSNKAKPINNLFDVLKFSMF